nr:hypothetical protein [Tanacetum cinerariifolium]
VLYIAKIFGVPFITFADIKDLMNGLEMGKHTAVWLGMTDEMRKDVMDSMYTTLKRITDENPSVARNVGNMTMDTVNPLDPVTTMPEGSAGGSKPEPTKLKVNFRSLSLENLCKGAKLSIPRKVVEMGLQLKLLLLSMNGSHLDVTYVRYLAMFKTISLKRFRLLQLLLLLPLRRLLMDSKLWEKKKKAKSKSTNDGQFSGHWVKQTVRYEPKETTSAPKKRATNVGNASKSSSMLKTTATSATQGNIPMSNPYSALDDESDKEVENVYDESANLFQSKKTSGSSSTFTDAAG